MDVSSFFCKLPVLRYEVLLSYAGVIYRLFVAISFLSRLSCVCHRKVTVSPVSCASAIGFGEFSSTRLEFNSVSQCYLSVLSFLRITPCALICIPLCIPVNLTVLLQSIYIPIQELETYMHFSSRKGILTV
ncbi:hypothetical protein DFH11DRAFT_1641025 [Phellopilus nigrolimitatus]|nr:hypothetical protein DFH11DRAFT_1641025 [Phellopilus nigrolimitatus]